MKSMLVIFLCFLFTSIWATSPEKQIEKLIFNVIEGNKDNQSIIAPDADAIIIKLLNDVYSAECSNLTEKLFLYELTQFLESAKKPSVYTVTIYSLEKGTVIHKRANKIKQNKINDLSTNCFLKNFLVIVSIGKDYPKEKILFISMRKNKDSFIIEPNACIFGANSFFSFSGFSYDPNTKAIYWEQSKKKAFIQHLRKDQEK